MVQWQIKDYRRLGDEHRTVVEMYHAIQNQIVVNQPIIFVNQGTRQPIVEIGNSLQGYLKLLFRRPDAIWELVAFDTLANFAGNPFAYRMVALPAAQLEKLFQQSFQMVVFRDEGFPLGTLEDCDLLRQHYDAAGRLPTNVRAYHFITVQELPK